MYNHKSQHVHAHYMLVHVDVAKITRGIAIQGAVFSAVYIIAWAHYGANTQDSHRQVAIAMFSALKSIFMKTE